MERSKKNSKGKAVLKISIIWNVMSSYVEVNQRVGGIYCIHLHGQKMKPSKQDANSKQRNLDVDNEVQILACRRSAERASRNNGNTNE
jgi:hypothetical protein